jgi:hypothetical protein
VSGITTFLKKTLQEGLDQIDNLSLEEKMVIDLEENKVKDLEEITEKKEIDQKENIKVMEKDQEEITEMKVIENQENLDKTEKEMKIIDQG